MLRTLTVGVVEGFFLLVFLASVLMLDLSDFQSAIVALSLAVTIAWIFLIWFPQRERMLMDLLAKLLRRK